MFRFFYESDKIQIKREFFILNMVQIVLIDYGVGNIGSLKRSFAKVGADVMVSGDKNVIKNADGLVLPGVGSFGPAMEKLAPLASTVIKEVEQGKPLMGICLGMQLYFTRGLEDGDFAGLDLIPGTVRKFPFKDLKIPQIGWNSLNIKYPDHPLYKDIPNGSYVYFVHSYYGDVINPAHILATTDYGITYPSSVGKDNIMSTQFHPEKSGKIGLQILSNYINYVKGRN
jgi:glutamine amidotransferase